MMPLIRTATGLAFEVFYRHRRLGGSIPSHGPAILVANHPNGLVDPIALMLATSRRLRFLAKAPLFRMPLLGGVMRAMGALPVYRKIDGADTADNQETFRAVFDALGSGELVCLFPEGKSHSEPALQALKTGAARMALGAEAQSKDALGVVVVPVGLVYGGKARFRSRMAVLTGEPISLGDLLPLFERNSRAAARELTERIAEGLRGVTVQLENWSDLPLIELIERIWPQDGTSREDRKRALAEGLQRMRRGAPEAADQLQQEVSEFRDRLEFLRLEPEQLDVSYDARMVTRFVLRSGGHLLITLPLATLGAVYWWCPYRVTGWISKLHRVDSDVVATQKFLIGLALFPLWWLGTSLLAWRHGTLDWGLLLAGTMPLLGALALRWGDRFRAVRRDVSGFLRFGSAESLKARLRHRRDELLNSISIRKPDWRGPSDPGSE